jgi:LysM repeat protein
LLITNRTFGRAKDYLPAGSDSIPKSDSLLIGPEPLKIKTSTAHSKTGVKSKGRKYHSIHSGDTLYSIALRNNTTVKNLCSINHIKAGKTLKVGTKLRVK